METAVQTVCGTDMIVILISLRKCPYNINNCPLATDRDPYCLAYPTKGHQLIEESAVYHAEMCSKTMQPGVDRLYEFALIKI